MERKFLGLDNGRSHVSRLSTCCKKRNSKAIVHAKWKEWKEVDEKFLTSSSRNFSYNSWRSSLSRARGFTPESVAQYVNTIQHNPARLYIFDETDITIVQNKHMKILGLKGMHQISSVQSAERGSLVTYVNSVSPTGHFLPPLLVYPGKYMKPELMHGTPPGSIYACHSSGWIQSEIFTQWFLHFIKHTKPTRKFSLLSRGGTLFKRKSLEISPLARGSHVDII